jgi:hypothetical protein
MEAEIEDMLTIEPRPVRAIAAEPCLMPRNTPCALTRMSRS